MKILLILAAHAQEPLKQKAPIMPLSLPILAGAAPEHEYEFIDMLVDGDTIDTSLDCDLVGISYRIAAEETVFKIADEFTQKGKPVVLGGAQVAANPLGAKKHANSVVIGEAEELWPILLNDFKSGNLKDFYVSSPEKFYVENATIYQSDHLPDLSKVNIPIRNFFKNKYIFETVYAARGCPINCDFCLVSEMHGKKMRYRKIDDVVNEIATFKKFYYILDDNVFGRKDNYDFYLELYEKIKNLPGKRYWTGQANLDAADNEKGRKVIRAASEAGMVYAAVGIESVNLKTLEENGSLKKMGVNDVESFLEKMEENIAFIQNQGISISGWFAIGYDNDTIDTYYQSLNFCLKNHIFPVFTPIQVFPGTRLYAKAIRENKLQSRFENVSSYKNINISDVDVIKALSTTTLQGYSSRTIRKNRAFYNQRFRNLKFTFKERITRLVFAKITQKKLKKISISEIERFKQRINSKK